MAELKRTPLYPVYAKYGAKTIPFGGWEMPVQFTSILEEHQVVRSRAGLFDVSHMGEIEIGGPDALALVQKLTTNDASILAVGQAQYSLMCYPTAGRWTTFSSTASGRIAICLSSTPPTRTRMSSGSRSTPRAM